MKNRTRKDDFVRIPKELFRNPKFREVSTEAKLLYGFLQDRASLSRINGEVWMDKNKDVFIYFPQNEIAERFCCSLDKAAKLLRQLEEIGLIKRTRRGQGKADRIVVNNVFIISENADFRGNEEQCLDTEKNCPNKNKKITKNNNTKKTTSVKNTAQMIIQQQINYTKLCEQIDNKTLDLIVAVIVEVLCSERKYMKIAGENRNVEDVHRCLWNINETTILYVADRIETEQTKIHSLRNYILAHLFFAESEMDVYFEKRYKREFSWGKNWEEGI